MWYIDYISYITIFSFCQLCFTFTRFGVSVDKCRDHTQMDWRAQCWAVTVIVSSVWFILNILILLWLAR